MDKVGVSVEPLLAGMKPDDVAEGEFSINPPPAQLPVLIRVQYHIDPVIPFAYSPERFIVSAGAFTHAN